jgi:DNA-binding LacI/PurR family transcriptional regulator
VSDKQAVVNLRTVAERVGLAVCSVSAILNATPASKVIPQRTKDRVLRAAAELNYRPNLWARSLRTKRTRMIAAITSDIGSAPVARVLAGVQPLLHRKGYLLVLTSADCNSESDISIQLHQRGIEGVVAIGVSLPAELKLPVASVDLDYITLADPLAENHREWLSELGETAAEAVIRQVERKTTEKKTTVGRMKIVPKLSHAYFNLPGETVEAGPGNRA